MFLALDIKSLNSVISLREKNMQFTTAPIHSWLKLADTKPLKRVYLIRRIEAIINIFIVPIRVNNDERPSYKPLRNIFTLHEDVK